MKIGSVFEFDLIGRVAVSKTLKERYGIEPYFGDLLFESYYNIDGNMKALIPFEDEDSHYLFEVSYDRTDNKLYTTVYKKESVDSYAVDDFIDLLQRARYGEED